MKKHLEQVGKFFFLFFFHFNEPDRFPWNSHAVILKERVGNKDKNITGSIWSEWLWILWRIKRITINFLKSSDSLQLGEILGRLLVLHHFQILIVCWLGVACLLKVSFIIKYPFSVGWMRKYSDWNLCKNIEKSKGKYFILIKNLKTLPDQKKNTTHLFGACHQIQIQIQIGFNLIETSVLIFYY